MAIKLKDEVVDLTALGEVISRHADANCTINLGGRLIRANQSGNELPRGGIVIPKGRTVTLTNGHLDWAGSVKPGAYGFTVHGTLELQGIRMKALGTPKLMYVAPGGRLEMSCTKFEVPHGSLSVVVDGGSVRGSFDTCINGLELGKNSTKSEMHDCNLSGPIMVSGDLHAMGCKFMNSTDITVTGSPGRFVVEDGEFHLDDNGPTSAIKVMDGAEFDLNADFSEAMDYVEATVRGARSKLILRRVAGHEDVLRTRSLDGGRLTVA